MRSIKKVFFICTLLVCVICTTKFVYASDICPKYTVDEKFTVHAWLKKNDRNQYFVSFNSYEPHFEMQITHEDVNKYFENPFAMYTINFTLEQKIVDIEGQKVCRLLAVFLDAKLAAKSDISSTYSEACSPKTFSPLTIKGKLVEITANSDFEIVTLTDGEVSTEIVCTTEEAEKFFGQDAVNKQVSLTYVPKQLRLDTYCLRPFFIESGKLLESTVTKKLPDTKKIALYGSKLQNFSKTESPLGKYINLAKNAYFQTFNLNDFPSTKDAAFEIFYDYYLSILTEIRKDNDDFLKKLAKSTDGKARGLRYAQKYGFSIVRQSQGQNKGVYVVKTDPSYLQNTFKKYISPVWIDYFAFEKIRLNIFEMGITDKNHKLHKKLSELGKAYLEKYPQSPVIKKVEEAMQ